MPSYAFMQVDAFTDRTLGGNPCAIVFDADDLDDGMRLAIAREMNLSETAFVVKSEVADVGARYFTPAEEIPMAGHPTIATIFGLVESGRLKLTGDHTQISLELKVGAIPIDIHARGGKVTQVVMSQKQPQFLATYSPAEVMPAFDLTAEDALSGVPIQTVSTGTPQLMIPLRDLEALKRARMNIPAYVELRGRGDFFSPHLFVTGGVTARGTDLRAALRHTAGHDGRPVHRLGYRRHGGLPVALRIDRQPDLHCRTRSLDEAPWYGTGGSGRFAGGD